MTYNFADSFDLYAAPADMINGYWDSGNAVAFSGLVAGRFSGSRALQVNGGSANVIKSSGANDAVHHLVVSFEQTSAIGGASMAGYLELFDGTTAQCSIVFRSDGAIVLTSGGPTGTALATYTGAFPVASTWYAFEFEVAVNATTGSFAVRKNGNTANDFTATGLNTQNSVNAYANKLQLGVSAGSVTQNFDDLWWRSGLATGSWLGDLRCYTRMPANDQSVHFTPSPAAYPLTPVTATTSVAITANQGRYFPFTSPLTGTVGSITTSMASAATGNFKCAIYSSVGGVPGTPLGSATPISAPGVGNATFTFGTPVAVTAGTQYFAAFVTDTSSGQYSTGSAVTGFFRSSDTYASFPTTNPAVVSGVNLNAMTVYITATGTANFVYVSEPQQDGLTTYIYDSNPGDADFYGLASLGLAAPPASIIATVTRSYMQKSDAGTRTAAAQLKSSATVVATPTLTLANTNFQWASRLDLTDPNTSAPWAQAAVDAAQIGPKVIA